MIPQDELGAWADEHYDAARVTEEKRYVRVLDAIGSTIAFVAYIATLLWARAADGNEGAVSATASPSAQTGVLVWCVIVLAVIIAITMAVAVARSIARCV